MKPKKWRVADFSCELCDFGEECFTNEKAIKSARQKVINHHKKTGHTVRFAITTIYTYTEEK